MAVHAHRRDRRTGPIGTSAQVAVGLAVVIVPIAPGGIVWIDVAALAPYAVIAAAAGALGWRDRLQLDPDLPPSRKRAIMFEQDSRWRDPRAKLADQAVDAWRCYSTLSAA